MFEFHIFVLRDKEINAEMIITVKYAAYAVGLKNSGLLRFKLWPLRYWCIALIN